MRVIVAIVFRYSKSVHYAQRHKVLCKKLYLQEKTRLTYVTAYKMNTMKILFAVIIIMCLLIMYLFKPIKYIDLIYFIVVKNQLTNSKITSVLSRSLICREHTQVGMQITKKCVSLKFVRSSIPPLLDKIDKTNCCAPYL